MTRPALILIDIQKDYFPGGRMELVGALAASGQARALLACFREKSLPAFHVQHFSTRPDATFFLPETEGVEIHEDVLPGATEPVIRKHFPNSFRGTDLQASLAALGVTELVFCGMMSHMCVDATVRAAFDLGYTCFVAHDACATRDLVFNGQAIPAAQVHGAYMAALGAVYARILGTEEIIKRL